MKIAAEQRARLECLAAKPDSEIDTDDIPEVLDWSNAVAGGLGKHRQQTTPTHPDTDLPD